MFKVTIATRPHIVEGPRSLRSAIGSKPKMACIAQGHPPPKVTWFRDGDRLHQDSNLRINATHISINSYDASHQGVYQCVVENEAGETQARSMLSLTAGNSLKAVTNVRCLPLNFTYFMVAFEAENKVCFI